MKSIEMHKILLVDDSDGDLLLTEYKFKQICSAEIYKCKTVCEASELLNLQFFDIVMLDFDLKKEKGTDLFEHYTNNKKDTYIVLLTGVGNEQIIIESFKKGIDDYYNKEDLSLFSIERILRSAKQKKENNCKMRFLEDNLLQTQKLESLGVLASGIAHDFNNLLTAMIGNIQIAKLKINSEEDVLNCLTNVEKVLTNATSLTNSMLEFSGKGVFKTEVCDISETIKSITRFLNVVSSRKHAIEYSLTNDCTSNVDKSQIQQVVQNLVKNSVDALKNKVGRIEIKTSIKDLTFEEIDDLNFTEIDSEGKFCCVSVSDNGIGMKLETIQNMFNPFYSTKETGRGLGMASVLGIIKAHRGGIKVKSEINNGTDIDVYFPYEKSDLEDSKQHLKASKEPLNLKILVVDDEDMIRDALQTLFETQNWKTVTAIDGKDGLNKFKSEQFDLIITDKTMPQMDGLSFISKVRKSDFDIPIILISGFSEEDIRSSHDELNINEFVKKPFDLPKLIDTVKDVFVNSNIEERL